MTDYLLGIVTGIVLSLVLNLIVLTVVEVRARRRRERMLAARAARVHTRQAALHVLGRSIRDGERLTPPAEGRDA